MLDVDLARLYGVETKRLNESVERNRERFPVDFLFELNIEEIRTVTILRSQIATSSGQPLGRIDYFGGNSSSRRTHGGRRYGKFAFTEQGVAMLSSVLNSPQAIRVNIEIMRAFVKLRALLGSNKVLVKRIDELEQKYDGQFRVVFQAIRELMKPEPSKKRTIGFKQ